MLISIPRFVKPRHAFTVVFVSSLLMTGIALLQGTTKYVSYSEFTYPVEMDFIRHYHELKKHGRQADLKPINPHPFQYIHFKTKCDFKENETTSLLILVKSAANNFHLRDAIRATWGNVTGENVEIVYLLAHRTGTQLDVDKEVALHGDIVQENFLDAYKNNTYKTIMGFNWAVRYCGKASYLVFADDDHYVNIHNILKYIYTANVLSNDDVMVGNLVPHGYPSRESDSKFCMSPELYPFDRLPPYLAGAVYLMSREAAKKMVSAFSYVKYLWIDDVYLGIVARKLGIELQHESRFVIPPYLLYRDPSHIVYGEFKHLADFKIVNRILKNSAVVQMCVFSWKCQVAFML